MKKVIIGISGASGVIYGIRMLEVLRDVADVETHLIMSPSASITIGLETAYTPEEIVRLADVAYRFQDIAAAVSSGSFKTEGMVVIPCSMKTLAGITKSFSEKLLLRADDVILKERRCLVLVARETPLHLGHLKTMAQLAELGATIAPPMPAFYHKPKSIDDIVNHTAGRMLDQFGIESNLFKRWTGLQSSK